MEKQYKITVDGREYSVTVEDLSEGGSLLYPGQGTTQLMTQLTGVGACAGYVLVTSAITWYVLKYTVGIRVSAEEEIEGLDQGEHGNVSYHGFVMANPWCPAELPPGTFSVYNILSVLGLRPNTQL